MPFLSFAVPKYTRGERERFLIGQNRTKRDKTGQNARMLEEVLFFPSYLQQKNIRRKKKEEKKKRKEEEITTTISSLSLCQFDAWRLAKGKGHGTLCLCVPVSFLLVALVRGEKKWVEFQKEMHLTSLQPETNEQ